MVDGMFICEISGEVGNVNLIGCNLLLLDIIFGLEIVIVKEILISGCEEEGDDSLREWYFIRVWCEVVSVNKMYYKEWVEEVDGVGKVKIFLFWNGDGMVKIVVMNVNFELVFNILI